MPTPPTGRPADRALCDELADRLAGPGGLHLARQLQLAGTLREPATSLPPVTPAPGADEGARPIGPWEPAEREGERVLERGEPSAFGDPWDVRRTIPARKRAAVRVCLLGESAAAGWFYAPHHTPARALEAHLRGAAGETAYEVVDLARVDLSAEQLVETAEACLQLGPDVLVVFAGNNWPVALPPHPAVPLAVSQAAALALRGGGLFGLMQAMRRRSIEVAEWAVGRIAEIASRARVPVVLVVPEVSPEWERPRPVAWLPGDASGRWHELHLAAVAAHARGEWRAAADAAFAMRDLDGGACATTHALLAEAHGRMGRADDARRAARNEVIARSWDNAPTMPGVTADVRDAMRRAAAGHGLAVVDLADLVAGAPPEARFFVDYCHLSSEGIDAVARAVGAEVRRLAPAGTATGGAPRASHPGAEVEAGARFLAGLYTAHWVVGRARPGPSAERWLEEALDLWPAIADVLEAYAEARAAPAEAALFGAAAQRVFAAGGLLSRYSWNVSMVDPAGLAAVVQVLERRGRPIRERITEALVRHHAVERRPRDLAAGPYDWHTGDALEAGAAFAHERRAFRRAVWPRSEFALVSAGGGDVRLELVARVPSPSGSRAGDVRVAVNGCDVGVARCDGRWRRAARAVPAAVLRRGINQLTLRWPPLAADGDLALRELTARLEQGVPADLHPVFGELWALRATGIDGSAR